MEKTASPELSLAPEPEQSQDRMDSCSQGFAEADSNQTEQPCSENETVAREALEEPEKSSRTNSEIKKTWGFRRSTVAKREMPVEATASSPDAPCPVRRSGRQSKRTDKLEEFLLTAKRSLRKSAPSSLESGDPPSQTPTDAETASEASFDGNADAKAVEDKAESPEGRTRSSTRKQTQQKSLGSRQTQGGGRLSVRDEGSSENEEDSQDAPTTKQLTEKQDEKSALNTEDGGIAKAAQPQSELGSQRTGDTEKSEHSGRTDDTEMEQAADKTAEDDIERPTQVSVKRGPIRTYVNKKKGANNNTAPVKGPATRTALPLKRDTKPRVAQATGKTQKAQIQDQNDEDDDDYDEDEDDDDDDDDDEGDSSMSSSSSSLESDEGGYDPNALYCICRQKHNKRFMICCDRCEEWFHGDCVGITEARGRLMERNGEDYICPNCTAKKNQLVRPATCILSASAEVGHVKPDAALPTPVASMSAEKTTRGGGDPNQPAVQPAAPALSSTSAGSEEKAAEDLGIKGRIEKATNPTGKKKIKIFQPALHQAEPKAAQRLAPAVERKTASASEQKAQPDTDKVASNVEVKTSPTADMPEHKAEDESSLPKCIGPGCEKNAQPDSVYCGNDCILRHAAAAMKSITDVKEPKQKDKTTAQKAKSAPKRSSAGGKRMQKTTREESDSEEDHTPDPDEDDEDEHAVEEPPPPATASWSSDHNYIAVTPEKTTPMSPTVLNKKSPPKEVKQPVKEPAAAPEKPSPASGTPVKGNKKGPTTRASKTSPKDRRASSQTPSSKAPKKAVPLQSRSTAKSKKPAPASNAFPPGPIHVTGALRVTKSSFTIPKKQPQPKDPPSQSQTSSRERPSPAPSSHSSSRPSHSAASAPPVTPMPPPPNNQMRQNIRRSLTDILYKRVSDSDDLKMTESEVGRLAVAIEKEMFNLCLSTDSKYKNKYRSLMFNLKDPKNKGLFYRVVAGDVSPFRLVRLSAEELLSKEISEWRKPEAAEVQSPNSRAHSGQSKLGNRHDSGSHSMDVEDAPPASDADDQDEAPSSAAQPSSVEGSSGNSMPDIFSSMLKDTTAEHRTHLFDLNCKICTGQKMEDEPAAKKAKLTKKPETKPPRQDLHSSRSGDVPPSNQSQVPTAYQHQEPSAPSYQSNTEPVVPEPHPQPYQENVSMLAPAAPAPVNPTVSSVSITRRDPRMARHGSGVTVSYNSPEKPLNNSAAPPPASAGAPVEVAPKAPLPMPPAPPLSVSSSKAAKTSSSEPPPEGETAIFLHGQEKIWKGLINMQTVAKFVTKAYLVSGSFEHLKEDLPDTIHIGGRISPNTVWDYVGKLKTSLSKELCLIRFHPATEEEEVAYVSLFSYFSSRKRFGVVANNNRRIKDLYLIPLGSKDPLPSRLLPFDGPGLEPARPNLLLGLLICQKDRKRAGAQLEAEEKRSKIQNKDSDDASHPKPLPSARGERSIRQSVELPFSTTPPGSPPPSSSETSSSATASSVLSFLSSVKAPATLTTTDKDSSGSTASSAPAATPLQTILNTLFGKKTHDSEASNSPSDQGGEFSAPATSMLDPIVQQFAQISKEKQVEEDEDDRPYDPEEEYDPSKGYNVPQKHVEVVSKPDTYKQAEVVANEGDDVAYDPEDDSIFDDVKPVVPGQAKAATEPITDPQRILENLRQIGDQTFQKQGEQQISSSPAQSTALPEHLLTQTKSLLATSQLLQLGKKVEELVKSSSVTPLINQTRDPRQSRNPHHTAAGRNQSDEAEEKEETSGLGLKPYAQPLLQDSQPSNAAEVTDASKEPETSVPEEEGKDEMPSFMESDNAEVSIPLLGEEVEPDMEVNYMDEGEVKTEEAEPNQVEAEVDKYSLWPNAASILKVGEDSEYEENSQETPIRSYYGEPANASTITSTIPVLTQNTAMVESQSHHIPHHLSASGFSSDYRPPADIPPRSNFLPPHLMHGQNQAMRPPPMSMPPPIPQGLPPMSAPPPIQGPPPPIHVPPPVRGPPPMQGDSSQQYGPPTAGYPPYQNQWPGTQPPQQQPPPGPAQNIMPARGPPPPFPPVAQGGPPPQIFDPAIPPQHIAQQGPPPGIPPIPNFDGPNNVPPPRFTGPPPPPFSFPASRGPPPPFAGPPPAHFGNRLPPPSHFPGPLGAPPSQYGDHGGQHSMMDQSRGPADQYNKLNMDQNPNSINIFKDNHGPAAGSAYRGPPSNQYEERRGSSSSGEIGGHFSPHHQYDSSRPHSPPPHRGSFDELRGPSHESRSHPSQPFGGSERYRFDRHSDEARPVRHSGPLLPTPSDTPLGPSGRIGGQSPDLHRDDPWRHNSPEIRRRSSTTREDSDPRSGERFSRFDGGHREAAPGPLQPSEERARELSEDRRRDRDRDGPHAGRPPWDRGQVKRWSREREWDRSRDRDRDAERSRERERSRGRDADRHRESERHRDQDSEKRRDRDRDRDRDRERQRDSDRRDHDRDRERTRDRERDRDRDRERERDRRRDRSRSRDRDRDRDRGKERGRDRDRDRDRDKDRERDKDRDKDRDRDKDKDKDKDRDRRDRSRSREKKEEKRDSKHDSVKESAKTPEEKSAS